MILAAEGDGLALLDARDKIVVDDPSGESDGAVDDGDVFLACAQIGSLEILVHVAFVRADKPRRHLDARSAQVQETGDVPAVEDAAGGDDGNLGRESVRCFHHFDNDLLQSRDGLVGNALGE